MTTSAPRKSPSETTSQMQRGSESRTSRLLFGAVLALALMLGMSMTALANDVAFGLDEADPAVYEVGTTMKAQADTSTISVDGTDKTVYAVSDGFYQDGDQYSTSTNFYITNKAGLKYLRDLVSACDGGEVEAAYVSAWANNLTSLQWYQGNAFTNRTVHLFADIDLNNEDWTPIGYVNQAFNSGSSKTQFYGNFDGHGHKISNLNLVSSSSNYHKGYGSYGLFGAIGSKAGQTFKNLTIENVAGVTDTETWDYVGAIVGNAGSNAVTFENCNITGTVDITGSYEVGGIYGIGKGSLTGCTVTATGTIASEKYYAGGLAGCARPDAVVSGCTVSQVTISAPYAGGLTGLNRVGGPEATSNATFANNTVSNAAIIGTKSASIDDCWGTRVATGEDETIAQDVAIPLTGISIEGDKDALIADETLQLSVSPVPEATTDSLDALGTPTWTSSDNAVATISDSGLVTAVGVGSATITATAGEHSATYSITVKGTAKVIDIDGATVVGTYETLAEAIAAATTGQTVLLSEGSFDLPATAVIAQDVTVTGAGKDKTTLVVTTENGDGVKIKLVRVHDGKVDVLSEGTNTVLTGESDKFSTYGIAYSDAKKTDGVADDSGSDAKAADTDAKNGDAGAKDASEDANRTTTPEEQAKKGDGTEAPVRGVAAQANSGSSNSSSATSAKTSAAKTGDTLSLFGFPGALIALSLVAGIALLVSGIMLWRRSNL